MKYFFLSENWTTGRVWEFGGLWNELAWQRKPHLQRQTLYIQENGENLWLYQAEDAVLMVEVMPQSADRSAIGQVVLKRLLTAEQVIERLCKEAVFHPPDLQTDVATSNAKTSAEPNVVSNAESGAEMLPELSPNEQPTSMNDTAKNMARKSRTVMARLRQLAGKGATTHKAKKSEHAQV